MLVFQQRVLSYMSTDKRNKVEIKQIKCGKSQCVTEVEMQDAAFRMHLIMLGIERNHLCVACIIFVQGNEKYVSYLLINRNELYANDVRRMNNGVFNTMMDEEEQ
ncbi:hypothetical protein T01_12768 [Trichinella spiralis]|uniref:Uncharacterized protein n=1 Tax=Trichinella spiralis TaxID=6334 RepID=A0A0V1AN21_TRISP|nr:hypothetical protein T01_12768 [Trichinella spiralis]